MNLFNTLRRWQRMLVASIMWVIRLPRTLNLVDLTIYAFAFPQHEWAKRIRQNLADDEFTITWRQAINPLYWMAWTIRFFVRWVSTRPYLTLAPAIPAFVFFMVLVATVLAIARRDPTKTQTIYLDTLGASLADGDTEVASVAAQRLLAIDPDNLEHQYQLAMLDEELGKNEAARSAIYRLALQKDYGPAALWMLKSFIYEDSKFDLNDEGVSGGPMVQRTRWSDDEKKLCHRCATIAMTRLPSQRAIFAKKMYAGFLADNGFAGDALRLYEAISEVDPGVNLAAAQLANQLAAKNGDYLTVQRFAKAAIRHIKPKMLADPTSVSTRLNYAQALVLNEDDEFAYKLLLDGLQITPVEILSTAAGEALVFTAERLKRGVGAKETLVRRGPILYEALARAPKSPVVLNAVVQFSIECSDAGDQELLAVRKKMLSGVETPAMHFIEGTVALMAGDNEAAQDHLELAAKEWTDMAGLLNNLAVTMTQSGDEKQLPIALSLSNAALDQLPDHPFLLETRGQIFLRLERYQDAVTDLEGALADERMRPLAHPALATAYQALGREDLAEQHRILTERYAPPGAAK